MSKAENALEEFQETILDERMAELELEFANRDLDDAIKKMLDIEGSHHYVVSRIVNNEPNAAQMLTFAKSAIRYEKEKGTFDPANWIGVYDGNEEQGA